MPNNKNLDSLRADVKALDDRLGALELQHLDARAEALQKSHDDLAVKLSEVKGTLSNVSLVFSGVSVVVALLGVVGVVNVFSYRKFEAARTNAHDILVVLFQDKIADTIDHISFADPSDKQHRYKITELIRMQEHLGKLEIDGDKFKDRSDLADAIFKLVIEDKSDEALAMLEDLRTRTELRDPFVYARASTLKAIALVRRSLDCEPGSVKTLVEEAIRQDSEVAAAFNILGLCLSNEAEEEAGRSARSRSAEGWRGASKKMQDAVRYYDLSFALKPTAWAMSKSLNNKVWGASYFFYAAIDDVSLIDQHLSATEYKDMDGFVADSVKQLALSKLLSPTQAGWWETGAELRGLQHAYYVKRNDGRAAEALRAAREELIYAIKEKCLYCTRDRERAVSDFKKTGLLKEFHADVEILTLIEKTALMPAVRR